MARFILIERDVYGDYVNEDDTPRPPHTSSPDSSFPTPPTLPSYYYSYHWSGLMRLSSSEPGISRPRSWARDGGGTGYSRSANRTDPTNDDDDYDV